MLRRWQLLMVLTFALLQGVVYLVLLPPWQHFDEPTHFEYAWQIAHYGRVPQPGEEIPSMRREVAASMLEHNFYWDASTTSIPNFASDDPIWLGFSELEHPPAYYALVSLPLRLIQHHDMTTQLYVARLVSLVLFVATIGIVAAVITELTGPQHPLTWAVPLAVALTPPFADLMTAVNNDVGATFLFSLFLWAGVRTIRYGISVLRLVAVISTAVLAALTKNTAAIALVFVPFVFLLAVWHRRGWRWRWIILSGGLGVALSCIILFAWGDAAYWYRWDRWASGPLQTSPTRIIYTEGTTPTPAVMVEAVPDMPLRHLLNPILAEDVAALRGRSVTVGGWVWAEEPITLPAPGLVASPIGKADLNPLTTPIKVTTEPTLVTMTLTLPADTGTLYFAFFGNKVADEQGSTKVFLRQPFLVDGSFDPGSEPIFTDATLHTGMWSNKPFTNVVRNANTAQSWPRLRPWVEQQLVATIRRSPANIFSALLDVQHNGSYMMRATAPALIFGLFGRFAWNHVRLQGTAWLPLFQALFLVTFIGTIKWWLGLRARTKSFLHPALIFLALAGLAIWINALAWPLPNRGARPILPAARYIFPAIIPTLLVLVGGWWALWPRRTRTVATATLVASMVVLNGIAVWTIWTFYRSLPTS